MIKAVIFDLDGTLYHYEHANEAGYRKLREYARDTLGMEPSAFDQAHKAAFARQEVLLGSLVAAMHNRYLRFQLILEEAGLPLIPHVIAMNDIYWNAFLEAMEPSPHLESALASLRQSGLKLGIGTNMTLDYQLRKLETLGVMPLLDFLVASEEVNSEKPEPKIFVRCAQKAGCAPEECLFIGDNIRHDVHGARAAGMQALWFAPDPADTARHPDIPSFQDFSELPGYVERLQAAGAK